MAGDCGVVCTQRLDRRVGLRPRQPGCPGAFLARGGGLAPEPPRDWSDPKAKVLENKKTLTGIVIIIPPQ